ncbi:MAG: hypothetical protein LBP98_07840 [Tannerella sp.]|jgi:hypothetical protein|nr:hypothetical protein [Tannerella sp.]
MMKFDEYYLTGIRSNDSRNEIVLREKGKTYRGRNPARRQIVVYRVDEGLIRGNTFAKCDYAVYTKQTDHVYLIELKGSDYGHALEQVNSTVGILLTRPELAPKEVNVRIVLSRYNTRAPGYRFPSEIKLINKLKQINGSFKPHHLKKESHTLTEDII